MFSKTLLSEQQSLDSVNGEAFQCCEVVKLHWKWIKLHWKCVKLHWKCVKCANETQWIMYMNKTPQPNDLKGTVQVMKGTRVLQALTSEYVVWGSLMMLQS